MHFRPHNPLLFLICLSLLTACSGNDSGNSSGIDDGKQGVPNSLVRTGVFIDSPVANLKYRTGSQSGKTNSSGEYSYVEGETVTFSVGGIDLPSVKASAVVTPLDLIDTTYLDDIEVTNILRLLQTLDIDSNPSNGIEIGDAAHSSAQSMTLSFSSTQFDIDSINLVSNSGSNTTELITAETAKEHFQDSLYDLREVHDDTSADISGIPHISHIGTTTQWDLDGQDINIDLPTGSTAGDLLILALHRTDDDLPLFVDGWTRAAECFKSDNGFPCATEKNCTRWHNDNYCRKFGFRGSGHDLAQSIFYKTVDTNETSTYTFNLNRGSSGHPGWILLTTLRGADTTSPIRDWSHKGCDGDPDSLFPSIYGEAGDMILLSQSFDDFEPIFKFQAPRGTTSFGYVGNSDETGYLFGGTLTSTGETGIMETRGRGAADCKDALISLTIKPRVNSENTGGDDTP